MGKIDHYKVNELYLIILSRFQVTIKITTSKKTTVDIWVKRLDTTVHHFWEASHIIDGNSFYPSIVKGNLGSTSRDNLPTKFLSSWANSTMPTLSETLIKAFSSFYSSFFKSKRIATSLFSSINPVS